MTQPQGNRRPRSGILRILAMAIAVLAMLPLTPAPAGAAGSAKITVSSFAADGTTPLPFARFQVTDSNGTVYGPLETRPPDGKVTFTVDLADNLTFVVEEETPPACGNSPAPLTVAKLAGGDEKKVSFSTDFTKDCTLGAIAVYKYTCPAGFDTAAADYATWSGACTETVDGSAFRFAKADNSKHWDTETGKYGIAGRAPLVGLEPGGYTVADKSGANTADSATPTVFCLTYTSPNPAAQRDPDNIAKTAVTNGAIKLKLNGGRIACDWFFAQGNAGTSGNGAANGGNGGNSGEISNVAAATGSITIHLAQCPAGYNAGNYFNDCHGHGVAGVTFSMAGPNSYANSGDTTIPQSPGPGIIAFSDLAAGTYRLSGNLAPDVTTVLVYCSLGDGGDQLPSSAGGQGGVDFDLAAGANVICDWFTRPEQGAKRIQVVKYTCPVGYDASGKTLQNLRDDCLTPTKNVTFTLTPDGGTARSVKTGADGKVVFGNLSNGTLLLGEDIPGEFSIPVAFCTFDPGGTAASLDTRQVEITNGATTLTLDDTLKAIGCDWFNIPQDLSGRTGSVTIAKLLCPAGLTSGYADNCTDLLKGVIFAGTGPNAYDQSATTDSKGLAVFDGLQPGSYVFTEQPSDNVNVAVYVVACTKDGKEFPVKYDDSTGLRVKLTLKPGDQVSCTWYNVPPAPAKPGAKGSITVNKFLCQGKKDNAYNWKKDCAAFTAGADFQLTATDGARLATGTTDGTGKLVFAKLADGVYVLNETSGDWCHAEAAHVDASGNVQVLDGGNTDVFIYNCTAKKINTLPGTGVGSAAGGAGTGLWALAGGLAGIVLLLAARRPRPAIAPAPRRLA